jgi:hypothetical protein
LTWIPVRGEKGSAEVSNSKTETGSRQEISILAVFVCPYTASLHPTRIVEGKLSRDGRSSSAAKKSEGENEAGQGVRRCDEVELTIFTTTVIVLKTIDVLFKITSQRLMLSTALSAGPVLLSQCLIMSADFGCTDFREQRTYVPAVFPAALKQLPDPRNDLC